MSVTSKFTEFEVNFVNRDESKVTVSGRNYERDIEIGDTFKWVYRVTSEATAEQEFSQYQSDERPVSLRVEAIEAYRRDVDILGRGVTGKLTLTGSGAERLKPASDSPFSYDLLRIERLEAIPRPHGLAEGQFVVPDDFDDPLPDEIQRLFAGR